jgi:hypothetical protein
MAGALQRQPISAAIRTTAAAANRWRMGWQQMRHYPAVLPTEAGEIVRLDKGLAKTHRLAVELFSGSGDEQGR